MTVEQEDIAWEWQGQTVRLGVNRAGVGRTVLLLPALSTISTRREMLPLQERLAASFATVAVDWPGFGEKPRPRIDWRPEVYRAFVNHLVTEVAPHPFATVAAGHAAGYVIIQATDARNSAGRLCLIAPTWRGPLPTVMGRRLKIFERIARAGDTPIVGPLLYWLNANRLVIAMMARGHVYANATWLTPPRLAEKLAVARSRGARYASVRFVAGALDPMQDRSEFLSRGAQVGPRVLVVYGTGTPRKSKAEMEALTALPNIRFTVLPSGKLSVHEEFPDAIAGAIKTFLAEAVV
jgi:pimeloyl-ACP methyl ester carboxylesterase